ncbi:hypothetical protein FOL47_008817 [Perkinsus chesapeaki]|uniref:Uncharacterized protein n=1 Tax=Perkinsus chesapeaki TaxID=330153 RepID=A0A7J6LBP0_PERCH|nr:hypothetical protein FOL47_008817 [Perkinsus chesapeaki]
MTVSATSCLATMSNIEDDEDVVMPPPVVSEFCEKLGACLRTRDFDRILEIIKNERHITQKPFIAGDLTAAISAVVKTIDTSADRLNGSARETLGLLVTDLALMYVKLSESELVQTYEAAISIQTGPMRGTDDSSNTLDKTLVAMQDHVARKKGKFMSSHSLARVASFSLRLDSLIRSEFFVPVAKELFNRGAKGCGGRNDGIRGLWTKAVPGSALLHFCESYSIAIAKTGMHSEGNLFWLLLAYLRTRTEEYKPADLAKGLRICHRRGAINRDIVDAVITRTTDTLYDYSAGDIVAIVDAATRFGCTDDARLSFSKIAIGVVSKEIGDMSRSAAALFLIGLSRFTGYRIKELNSNQCVHALLGKLADAGTGAIKPFEVVEIPKCLLKNSLIDAALFLHYYGLAQNLLADSLSAKQLLSLFVTYSKAGVPNAAFVEGLCRALVGTGAVLEFPAAQLLAVYRAMNRLEAFERRAECFAKLSEQINTCIYQLIAMSELEVSESLALLEEGAIGLDCGPTLVQHALSDSSEDGNVRGAVEKLIEASEKPSWPE